MRYLFLLSLLLMCLNSSAQDDSLRVISMKEVRVEGKARSQSQQLFHFYRANLGSTIEDMMSRLPEMNFIRRGAYGMEPSIRGLSGGQVNVMIDGMRIYGACTDKMDPVTIYIEPNNLDNILVGTGASALLNGSSVGGMVNMKMAEPSFNGDRHSLLQFNSGYQTGSGSFNTSVKAGYHAGQLAILGSGTYRNATDYRAGGGENVPHSAYRKANYSLSAKYTLKNNVHLKADLLGDDGWNIGYPALPMDVGYAAARIGSLSLRTRNMEIKAYANSIRHFMDDTQRENVTMHMDMPGISKTRGFYLEKRSRQGTAHSVEYRADVSSSFQMASMTMYQPGSAPMYMLTWPDNRKLQAGAGANWKWRADSNWTLLTSFRADLIRYTLVSDNAKQEAGILGNAGPRNFKLANGGAELSRKAGRRSIITASVKYANRAPTGSELYGFYLFNRQDGFDYLGDPLLLRETSLQAELSFSRNTDLLKWRAAVFANRIGDYIMGIADPSLSTMTQGASGVKRYTNIPYAHIIGMEASAIFQLSPKVQFVTTLRYNRGSTDTGSPLPMIAPLKNISSLRIAIGPILSQLEYEGAAAQQRFNNDYGEDATAGFSVFHIRLNHTWKAGHSTATVQCGVENLLDKYYHEHTDWGNIPRMGRNVYLQLRWNLN